MLICCVYRPPSQHAFFDKFLSECEAAQMHCPRLSVLGDVNVDLLKSSCSLTKLFLSIMKQLQLTDLVCVPTRVTINSSSQIDVLLTTDVHCFDATRVYPFSGSDHCLIVSHFYSRGFRAGSPSHRIISVRNYQKLDKDKLDEIFMCDDIWDDVLSKFDNLSDCLECFNLIINGLLYKLVPLKNLRVRQRDCPWLSNASLTKARRLRDIAHRKALKSGSLSDWSSYKSLRNRVNSMLRSAKAKYFENLSSSLKSTPTKFWRHFRSLSRSCKPSNGIQLSVSADVFNEYFLSIPHKTIANVTGSVPACEFLEKFLENKSVPQMRFSCVDVGTVSSVVTNLNVHKATGADGVSARFVKASPFMVRVITVLINRCIESSTVPNQWKQAIVTPVPKVKHCTSMSHFRPISVLPTLSKILERILYDQMVSHLNKYNLLTPHQSGFRSGYSTHDVLLYVTDKWIRAIDRGEYTGAVFLDLAKAFDTVDHAILCSKLQCYGFHGASYALLCDYLLNRQQRLVFNGNTSDWGTVTIGVPQGSVLGPLLFALYINDLPSVVDYSTMDLYADDAELHYSHSDLGVVEAQVQSDLDKVAQWISSSHLCLNVVKSTAMLIGSRQRISGKSFNVSIGGMALSQVDSVRYLGVIIDPTLSWSLHITNIASGARSRLSSIFRYGTLTPAVLCLLYSAFVLPLFDYCDVVWCPTTAKFTALIERTHSKFMKKLPALYQSKFSFTLVERRKFHTAIQIFKSIHQKLPSYLHNIFHYSRDITGHIGRNINRLFVPRVNNNYGKRSFYYRGAMIWNSLPSTVTESTNLSKFVRLYHDKFS